MPSIPNKSNAVALGDCRLICGDCIDVIEAMSAHSVDLVCTSPPYAEQRKEQYGGVCEDEYPSWTVRWMEGFKRVLKPNGSVVIVIRPHIRNGQISDYVLKTRLLVRASGWIEAEELIWIKPSSPALGSLNRPRRAWEHILWFSLSEPYCDSLANGSPSSRVGLLSTKGVGDYIGGVTEKEANLSGVARCRDYVSVGTGTSDKGDFNTHPATYPTPLCEWIIKLLCPPSGTVFDPFTGSGSTAVACVQVGRSFVGSELNEEYCNIAVRRIREALVAAGKSNEIPLTPVKMRF